MKRGVGVLIALLLVLAPWSAAAQHWTPPVPTSYWEAIYGYLVGSWGLSDGDEVAAFRVDNHALVGQASIIQSGSDFLYSMFVYSLPASVFDVYFVVWDGTMESSAVPGTTITTVYGGGSPQQHDLENGVPEPPGFWMMVIAAAILAVMVRNGRRGHSRI